MSKQPKPRDRREEVALFRASVVGALVHRVFERGELTEALRELSQRAFRPPGSAVTRIYGFSTLERWYQRYRDHGLEGLKPESRRDQGHARTLTDAQRTLLLDIRKEHPSASSRLIIRTLENLGRLTRGALKPGTLNRLYADHNLRRRRRKGGAPKERLRWRADRPHRLWHADVCHGPGLIDRGKKVPVRIHGILDDYSRDILALEALSTEKEVDMLRLFLRTLLIQGRPDAIYLDNGATYRGQALQIVCERLDITLIHAKPRQPKARGKMERLWRTLREQCLDYVAENGNLAQLNGHLATFRLDYRTSPHAGLMGDTPQRTVAQGEAKPVDEAQLRAAFTVDQFRKVKGDSTLQIGGKTYQVKEHHLSGKKVRVQVSLLDERPKDFVTYQKQKYRLEPVDPIDNGRLRRNPVETETPKKTGFDPNTSRTREVIEAIKKAEKDSR